MTFRAILAAALVALASPSVVSADETARAANQLALGQIGDVISTRVVLSTGTRCEFIGHRATTTVQSYEADPLARPFARSTVESIAAAAALNIGLRLVFHHAPAVLRILAAGEGAVTASNERINEQLRGYSTCP